MILARKNGWLIAGSLIKESKYNYYFKTTDTGCTHKISKSSRFEKLFDDVNEAMKWIKEGK